MNSGRVSVDYLSITTHQALMSDTSLRGRHGCNTKERPEIARDWLESGSRVWKEAISGTDCRSR